MKAVLIVVIVAVLGYLVWERHFSRDARIESAFNACMNRNNQRFNDWLAADQAWMNQQIANGGLWDYSTKPPLPASEKCV